MGVVVAAAGVVVVAGVVDLFVVEESFVTIRVLPIGHGAGRAVCFLRVSEANNRNASAACLADLCAHIVL